YTRNAPSKSWGAHGRYLGREGAARTGERGLGFDQEREDSGLAATLSTWQEAGDSHVFKIIVSPERGEEVDLQAHVRELMRHMQSDLETALQWAGIVHTNTGRPHAHLVVRGIRDDGEALTIEPSYISHGIRFRSRELLTRELGYRTELELQAGREAGIERTRMTELDRGILHRADAGGGVEYSGPDGRSPARDGYQFQQMRRLRFLETMGLAEKTGVRTWKLDPNTRQVLRELGRVHEISRTLATGRLRASDPNAALVFSRLEDGERLHGRLIGMGLDESGREGSRYLLIEGTDGRIHFVAQTASIESARGEGRLRLDSFVSLSGRSFEVEQEQQREPGSRSVKYVGIEVDGLAAELSRGVPPLALDLEIVEKIQATGRPPPLSPGLRGFAREWDARRVRRVVELEQSGVIRREPGGSYLVASSWERRLDRFRFASIDRARREAGRLLSRARSPEALVGRVITRGVRSVLVSTHAGELREIQFSSSRRRDAPDRGAEILLRTRSGRDRTSPTQDRKGLIREHTREHRNEIAHRPRARQVIERLSKDRLRAARHEFTRMDEILATVGELPLGVRGGPVLEALRERQELWRRRGIGIGKDFERGARSWIQQAERGRIEQALQRVRGRYSKPVEAVRPLPGLEYRGRVVGLTAYDGGRLLLLDTGRGIRAIQIDEARLKLGQEIRVRSHPLEAGGRRVQRVVWRVEELEHVKQRERERSR
ncbi:MAG: DUF3363 domain-containing protein, partial [Gemmatimonadota bacterium]